MNNYIAFLSLDGKREMTEVKGDSQKIVIKILKENGYKILAVISKELFENYRSRPPYEFFEKYFTTCSEKLCRWILNKMFK